MRCLECGRHKNAETAPKGVFVCECDIVCYQCAVRGRRSIGVKRVRVDGKIVRLCYKCWYALKFADSCPAHLPIRFDVPTEGKYRPTVSGNSSFIETLPIDWKSARHGR